MHADDKRIVAIKFVVSVRWADTENTSLDLARHDLQRFKPRISWHPRGVLLEGTGLPTLIVPPHNVAWVRLG